MSFRTSIKVVLQNKGLEEFFRVLEGFCEGSAGVVRVGLVLLYSVYLPTLLSISQSVCLSVCLSACLHTEPS